MTHDSRAHRIGLLIGAAALSFSAPAVAQDMPPADDGAHWEGDIVVTASKRAEPLQEVPSAVSAVSGRALELSGASRLGEILGSTPGVTLKATGYPGRNALVLRGISSGSSQAASSVGIYIDDTPVGSSTVFSVAANLAPDIDPYDLERVEVLRGPQGTLYGANTLGGLLKFVTKAPDLDRFEVGGRLQGSTTKGAESYLAGANLNIPIISDRLAFRASGSYRRDAGWIDNVSRGTSNINDSRSISGRATLLFQATDNLSVKLSYLYQSLDADASGYVQVRPDASPLYGDLKQATLLEEPTKSRFHIASGVVSYDFGGMTLSSISSYAYSRNKYRRDSSPDFSAAFGTTNPVALDVAAQTEKFTQEVRLATDASRPLSAIVGVFYTSEDTEYPQQLRVVNSDGSTLVTSPFARAIDNLQLSEYREKAVFGNLTYVFSPAFDVTLGARYSENDQDVQFRRSGLLGNPSNPMGTSVVDNSSSDKVTTYLANARLHVDADKMFYVRVASGYRPGGPRNFPPVVIPPSISPQFLPDTVWNYEIGLKSQWLDDAVTLNVAAYRIDWKNIQLTQLISGFNLLSNGGRARSEGVELEAVLRPTRGLAIRYNAAYTDARLIDAAPSVSAGAGDAIPYIPRWALGVDASYNFAIASSWDASVGVNYQLQDKRVSGFAFDARRMTLPSYDTIDLRAAITSDDGLEINAFVRNLGDTRGIVNSEPVGATIRAALIQPRTIGIGVRKSF